MELSHLQCPETTFYLPLLEFELLQEPAIEQDNLLKFSSIPYYFSHVTLFILNTTKQDIYHMQNSVRK